MSAHRRVSAAPLEPGYTPEENITYVTTPEQVAEVAEVVDAASVVGLDIETAVDREGLVYRARDAQVVTPEPVWNAQERRLIGIDQEPVDPVTRGDLEARRLGEYRQLLLAARAEHQTLSNRLEAWNALEAPREMLAARMRQLAPYVAVHDAHLSSWGPTKGALKQSVGKPYAYGLRPSEGVVRLIQIGVDEPGLGRQQFVIDCYHVDPTPVLERIERDDLAVLIFNASFERGYLGYHYGTQLDNVIDLLDVARAVSDARSAHGDPVPPNHRLGTVYEFYSGSALSKEEQVSDWNAAELSAAQVRYAGLDAQVMFPLLVRLAHDAERLGLDPGVIAPTATPWRQQRQLEAEIARRPDERAHAQQLLDAADTPAALSEARAMIRQLRLTAEGRAQIERDIAELAQMNERAPAL